MKKVLTTVAQFALKQARNAVLRKVLIHVAIGSGLVIAGVNISADTVDQIVAAVVSITP